jgi:hypothetical protein
MSRTGAPVQDTVQSPYSAVSESKPRTPDHVDSSHIPSGARVSLNDRIPFPTVAKLSPPIGQFVINTILQMAAFAAAIAFGVYAVKSVTVANDANHYAAMAVQQALTANQLAILAVCLSGANQVSHGLNIISAPRTKPH